MTSDPVARYPDRREWQQRRTGGSEARLGCRHATVAHVTCDPVLRYCSPIGRSLGYSGSDGEG